MSEQVGPRLPRRNGMPDLGGLDLGALAWPMAEVLTGRGDFQSRSLLLNLARLVDRALVDYADARRLLDVWRDQLRQGNPLGGRFQAVAALEACIDLTWRAYRLATKLADLDVIDRDELPARTDADAVGVMRNAIEHTEYRLTNPNPKRSDWPPFVSGQYPFLSHGDDDVALGPHRLEYLKLANVLTALHAAVRAPVD